MDLALTEHQRQLKTTAREFMARECPRSVLLELNASETGYDSGIWEKAAEIGFLGALIPERHGGTGGSFMDTAIIYEEFGKGPLPGPYFSSAVLGNLVVQECATENQKAELLPRLASGEEVLVLALTEQRYGWEPGTVSLRAERRGDHFVLNGAKVFVHDALSASKFLCVARVGRAGNSEDDLAIFIVDAEAGGVSRRHVVGFGGNVGEIKFDDVEVPVSAEFTGSSDSWQGLERAIHQAIPILSAYKAGACEAVFQMSVEYSRSRIAFGVPIGRFQRVQDHIIEVCNRMDAARWTTYEALWKLDTGPKAATSVHLAKVVASEGYYHACNFAHEAHGGIGTSHEYGLTLHTEMSRSLYHYLGSPLFHRRRMVQALLASESGSAHDVDGSAPAGPAQSTPMQR